MRASLKLAFYLCTYTRIQYTDSRLYIQLLYTNTTHITTIFINPLEFKAFDPVRVTFELTFLLEIHHSWSRRILVTFILVLIDRNLLVRCNSNHYSYDVVHGSQGEKGPEDISTVINSSYLRL